MWPTVIKLLCVGDYDLEKINALKVLFLAHNDFPQIHFLRAFLKIHSIGFFQTIHAHSLIILLPPSTADFENPPTFF